MCELSKAAGPTSNSQPKPLTFALQQITSEINIFLDFPWSITENTWCVVRDRRAKSHNPSQIGSPFHFNNQLDLSCHSFISHIIKTNTVIKSVKS